MKKEKYVKLGYSKIRFDINKHDHTERKSRELFSINTNANTNIKHVYMFYERHFPLILQL